MSEDIEEIEEIKDINQINEELEEEKNKLIYNSEISIEEKIKKFDELYEQYFKDVKNAPKGEVNGKKE